MRTKTAKYLTVVILAASSLFASPPRGLKGTLVVAVPVKEGLVVCSDTRLYNDQAKTFTDTFVKIHKVDQTTLFVATNTVGFLDKSSGKMSFDVFELTSNYVERHGFSPTSGFWNGLKSEIRDQLRSYLRQQKFEDLPETDVKNNRLLFNLVFYTVVEGRSRSYTIRVFYEKARTPVIDISGPASELVRTPKLSGKGRDVMRFIDGDPSLRSDPSILRFDQTNFDIQRITIADAVEFARRLFFVTNTNVPAARVSATYDCAMLDYQNGFRWISDSERKRPS